MRAAAIEAGLVQSARAGDVRWRDRLRIITYVFRHDLWRALTPIFREPEAAAVHCARLTDLHKLRPSQNFMICDAGGGTVVRILFVRLSGIVGDRRPKGPGVLQDYWPRGPKRESRDRRNVCTVGCQLRFTLSGSSIPGARQNALGRSPCTPGCGESRLFHAFVQSDRQTRL